MRFVEQYVLDLDLDAAAKRAHVSLEVAQTFLRSGKIMAAVQVLLSSRSHRNNIYADDMLRRWMRLMDADPRELIEIHRVNCRYCWGDDNRYQFTLEEFREARIAHTETQRRMPESQRRNFDERGGVGYNGNREPSSECTECFGNGIERVYVHDSRTYSAQAAALYEGVEITRDGKMRVLMRDRSKAEAIVAQHIGMLTQRHQITLDPMQLNDEQLADAIQQFESLIPGSNPGAGPPLLEYTEDGGEPSQDG